MGERGGGVMVNFFSGFLDPEAAQVAMRAFDAMRELRAAYPDNEESFRDAVKEWRVKNPMPAGTVHTLVDHIDHIVKVAGIDSVGLAARGESPWKLRFQ
jgi:membrane dipeptidase